MCIRDSPCPLPQTNRLQTTPTPTVTFAFYVNWRLHFRGKNDLKLEWDHFLQCALVQKCAHVFAHKTIGRFLAVCTSEICTYVFVHKRLEIQRGVPFFAVCTPELHPCLRGQTTRNSSGIHFFSIPVPTYSRTRGQTTQNLSGMHFFCCMQFRILHPRIRGHGDKRCQGITGCISSSTY